MLYSCFYCDSGLKKGFRRQDKEVGGATRGSIGSAKLITEVDLYYFFLHLPVSVSV